MMRLKLITFDVTNTLLRIRGSVGEHYAAVANKYYGATGQLFEGQKTEIEFVWAYKEVNTLIPNFGFNDRLSSESWWYEVVHRVFFSLGLRDFGILKSISNQLYTDYCSKDNYELFPEVREVLAELRKVDNMKLGVISNFDERLDFLLEQFGIRQFFDMVLCSRVIGIAKPELEMFSTALALSGNVKPSEALHVGDNVELDYFAPRKIGFNTLLIKREEQFLDGETGVLSIDSLEKLLPSKLATYGFKLSS